MRYRRITVLALAGTLLAVAAQARDFEDRIDAEPGGYLYVELPGGEVEIEPHDDDEVRVEVNASGFASRASYRLVSDGREVRFEVDKGGLGWLTGGRVRARIRVPEEFSVHVQTRGGKIEIEGLMGDVVARTLGAEIKVSEIEGNVDLFTRGGRIEADEIEGDVRGENAGGPLEVEEIAGAVWLATSGGSIQAKDVHGPVEAETTGGSIQVRFTGPPAGRIETTGGSIEIEMPEGEGAILDAAALGGRIELDGSFEVTGSVGGNRVEGQLGQGGDSLRVRSTGGSIKLKLR
jgi:DUF4097 and DUF4098 domain-containing protein YvlB